VATGRYPDTLSLGCESNLLTKELGIKMDKNGKIIVDKAEQTSISNIFAIGDVASGKLELTPPAIMAGQLLAKRILNVSNKLMNYNLVATTVFTPLEYGACGYSEEDAISKFGE
jgi:pyruvate/2-oxoglutarate dehydrogenase complex dihydrolipoamide dehydrogenase (E3) component